MPDFLRSARNVTRDVDIGAGIREAGSFFDRLRGLLGTEGLMEGEGLWISPCTSIHSFGMRFEFDAIFLDRDRKVVGLYERFRRNRISRIFWSARGVLELPAGTIGRTGTEVGDEIRFEERTIAPQGAGQSFD
ncbi:MAG: DUF192 domain-containing protein [Deltaproteobacteria bacterium]|nr:DUF192 domain-containing protein [Deltaproteobacteria bacterium]